MAFVGVAVVVEQKAGSEERKRDADEEKRGRGRKGCEFLQRLFSTWAFGFPMLLWCGPIGVVVVVREKCLPWKRQRKREERTSSHPPNFIEGERRRRGTGYKRNFIIQIRSPPFALPFPSCCSSTSFVLWAFHGYNDSLVNPLLILSSFLLSSGRRTLWRVPDAIIIIIHHLLTVPPSSSSSLPSLEACEVGHHG